ncbi:MAG TPA: VCBS repeat-containing protein, partial [Chryseosolibacter sp.]
VHKIEKGKGKMRTAEILRGRSLPFNMEHVSYKAVRHQKNGLVDFNRDRLLPMMYSNETPALATADIDGDKIPEVYIDLGKDQSSVVLKMNGDRINVTSPIIFKQFSLAEQTKSHFVDVDGDDDLDLYMASGGRFFPPTSSVLIDQVLLNDGQGKFTLSAESLPFTRFISTSVVKSFDFDLDGDKDLVVGERFNPFVYGQGGSALLFANDGKGKFSDVTKRVAPMLQDIGMVTDIEVLDYDKDGWDDIVIAGDWTSIRLLKNEKGQFKDGSSVKGLGNVRGWWNDVEVADLNKDGVPDLVCANHGLNTFFKAGDRMYVADFDDNGTVEQIFCTSIDGKDYPVLDKDDLLSQLPGLKKQLLYYKDYARRSIDQLFRKEKLAEARVYEVDELASVVFLSDRSGGYKKMLLPKEAQFSPLYAILIDDIDNDGIHDVIAGGNQYLVKPQFGRYDGSDGWFFKGRITNREFTFDAGVSLNVRGQIRDIEMVESKNTKYLLFAKYDDELEIFKILQ